MIRNKIRKYITIGLMLGSILMVGIAGIPKHEKVDFTPVKTIVSEKVDYTISKFSVVDSLTQVSKLTVLEVNESQKVTLQSKGKSQEVEFKLITSYAIDFSKITTDNIHIDNTLNKIYIYLDKPSVVSDVQEQSTKYGEINKKWYMFNGDLKFTQADLEAIIKGVEDKVVVQQNNMTEAKNSAVIQIENIINTLTKNNYSVEIKWVN